MFRLQVHFHANQTHFHVKGLALGLVLKQRHKGTRKWPILVTIDRLAVFRPTFPALGIIKRVI